MKIILFLLPFLIFIPSSLGARFLVGYALDGKSHLRSLMPLMEQLTSSGHHLTLFYASSEPIPTEFGPNVSIIHAALDNKEKENKTKEMSSMIWGSTLHAHMIGMMYYLFADFMNVVVVNHSQPVSFTFKRF
jgi:hypothetical protein